LEAEQPGRQSEGNFNRGFSTKTHPAIYLPNIIPALLHLRYEASQIWKLSRKLPADFEELPLPAVTGLMDKRQSTAVVAEIEDLRRRRKLESVRMLRAHVSGLLSLGTSSAH
jgi:hypothetical protein